MNISDRENHLRLGDGDPFIGMILFLCPDCILTYELHEELDPREMVS